MDDVIKNKQRILSYFAKEAWRHKKLVIPILAIAPLSVILGSYIAPLFIAYLLANIQSGAITLESSVWILVGYFVVQVLTIIFAQRFLLWLMWAVQVRGEAHLYHRTYEKLSKHSLAFYANTFTGSLVSKINRFTAAYMDFIDAIVWNVIPIITTILATVIGLSFFFWQLSVALLVLCIVFIISAYFGTRFMRKRFIERSEAYTKISGSLSDSISNMTAVKTDAREKDERKLLGISIDNMMAAEMKARSGTVRITSVYASILTLMRMSVLVASILAIQAGIADAALIYIALTYTFNLIDQMWHVSGLLRNYFRITGDSAEMLDIIMKPADIADRSKRRLTISKPSIEFQAIDFAHLDYQKDQQEESDEKPVKEPDPLFTDFSLHIPAHQKVGLVGVSGSGKSTLLRLLMRFYDVDKGKITIDNHDISRVTQESLHHHLGYVPQEPALFHRSLRDNIAYARPNASIEEVREAAKQANALEFIEKLPDGFDTLVGERGVKLSGGQRQRIAIARAILKDAPILILDEATSALDSESEKLIQDALQKLMKGRTSIVIAHRLSTIAKLDRIVVLDNGKIIEDGSHTELLAQNGIYAKLWTHQSGGFIEE